MTEQATDTSFPTRERGLKFTGPIYVTKRNVVVPHAGTWIEILLTPGRFHPCYVVPHAGTWIEISNIKLIAISMLVVPHAGTWIEIGVTGLDIKGLTSRSPRGNVD